MTAEELERIAQAIDAEAVKARNEYAVHTSTGLLRAARLVREWPVEEPAPPIPVPPGPRTGPV